MDTTYRNTWLPEEFNDFFDYVGLSKGRTTSPAINVKETRGKYIVEMAAPGMKKENFTVHINDEGNLVIKMENHRDATAQKEPVHYLRRDFSYADFEQTLILPDDVDREKIAASVADGVLMVDLPKVNREETKVSRQIQIG